MSFPSYILAGGKSSRFGSDKALAQINGVSLIERVAFTLRRACDSVTVVADKPGKYAGLDVTTCTDRLHERGPLGGLHAALSDRIERFGDGWIVLASCDLAGLKHAWVATIVEQIAAWPDGAERLDRPDAIAFRGPVWQPFPAAYHSGLLPVVADLLDGGRASFQRLLSDPRANARALPLPADWPDVVQVNTPLDLEHFRTDGCSTAPRSSTEPRPSGNGDPQ